MLDRLSGVGLTVSGDKSEFRLSKLTFFGHELTSDGVNPSEEKIAAIRDASHPRTQVKYDRLWILSRIPQSSCQT